MRYGYFDNDAREYVIERPDVPVSWTNYLGVRDLCAVISHNAGGYAFYRSAEHGRVTRFRPNGVPLDRPGHYVYIRDEDTGEYWTVSWQPVGLDLAKAKYEVRHGLSYSKFSCDYLGIHAEQTLFIPVADDVELWDVHLRNASGRTRRLSVFSYVEFSFGHVDIDNQNFQMSLYASGADCRDGIIEFDFFYEPWTYRFFAGDFQPDGFDCVRDAFIGPYRTETNPSAVERGACSGSAELGGNHCGSLQKRVELAPGEEARLVFMLGVGARDAAGYAMQRKYSQPGAVDQAFAELKDYWERKTRVLQVQTPHEGLNTMLNTWTLYQAETCVVWSRFASFVEVGGRTGLGYRDTSQDVMAVPHTNPGKVKERMVELLHGQVRQGYGLHLFDPEWFKPQEQRLPGVKLPTVTPAPRKDQYIHGLADVCSDDHLWIVASVCEYVKETGDFAFFDEVVPFADEGQATVYEHLKRALDFSASQIGANGICLGLRADWNDCLNLGGGESAMAHFIFHWALQTFCEAARFLGRHSDALKYQELAQNIAAAAEAQLWDGEWYLRGFTKSGRKIGSHESAEGKIHLNGQSWAVLSGVAPRQHALACMDAVDTYLYSPFGVHLCWPSYSQPDDEIGYVTRVYKGVKENGSIFSHPNPWVIIAETKLGRGDRAMKCYDALLPHRQNDMIETRQAEPYSYCQFIMGRDHTAYGRARHPWLTGTAGWMYTAATKHILGIQVGFEGLTVAPCIPAEWPGFSVIRQWRGATYRITVLNPDGAQQGVRSVTLNGQPAQFPLRPCDPGMLPAGSVNDVLVMMGDAGTEARNDSERS